MLKKANKKFLEKVNKKLRKTKIVKKPDKPEKKITNPFYCTLKKKCPLIINSAADCRGCHHEKK